MKGPEGNPLEMFAFEEVDRLIIAGRTVEARTALLALSQPTRPTDAVRMASLLRRTGLTYRALAVVHPFLFPEDVRSPSGARAGRRAPGLVRHAASTEVLLEYALNLARLGGGAQALAILESFAASSASAGECDPGILYALAASHTTAWNYDVACALFGRWLDLQEPGTYAEAVGRLNHAHCCLRLGHLAEAQRTLSGVAERSRAHGWMLILANVSELTARLRYLAGDFKGARAPLAFALSALADRGLADKLNALRLEGALLCAKNETAGRRQLAALRAEAWAHGHGETAREIDLFLATTFADRNAALRVFYGSPQAWFQEKAQTSGCDLGEAWTFSGDTFEPSKRIERGVDGTSDGFLVHPKKFKVSGTAPVAARIIAHLASDFYRSWPPVALHVALFPDRIFHPVHSPQLVHAHIARVKGPMERRSCSVLHASGGYRLRLGSQPVAFRRSGTEDRSVKKDSREGREDGPFSLKHFAQTHALSTRTAHRILAARIERGEIERRGRGPSTHYVRLEHQSRGGA